MGCLEQKQMPLSRYNTSLPATSISLFIKLQCSDVRVSIFTHVGIPYILFLTSCTTPQSLNFSVLVTGNWSSFFSQIRRSCVSFHFFLTEVSRGNPNLFFYVFLFQVCLNSLPRARPAGCYSGALTTRLEALSR